VIQARKRFGQHFLHDPAIIARIVTAVGLKPDDAAVEVGPGQGALTAALLPRVRRLDAIEIDRDLLAVLRGRFTEQPGLVLHEGDALEFDWASLARERGARLRLIGNLPYNISTPLLFRLLESSAAIADMHFMLQREVVDRILAAPGTAAYGRLTVMLAPRLERTRVLDLGAGAFKPAPKVASSVVRLRLIDSPPVWSQLPQYAAIVAAAFGQRRKMLRNALERYLTPAQIHAVGVDPSERAERLTAEQFGQLAAAAAENPVVLAPAPEPVIH
jgi:16S rRNA (adenine1518-N6/adenine1519-N6)-dimethyltransferase